MKTKVITVLSALCVTFIAGFVAMCVECNRLRDVAGRMSDTIRSIMDSYEDKDCPPDLASIEETCGVFLWDDAVGPYIKLEDYSYCY